MIKLDKKVIIVSILITLILISSCSKLKGKGTKTTKKTIEDIRTGTQGLIVSFLPNAPPDRIHVEQGAPEGFNTFDVVLKLENKGAYPQPNEGFGGLGLPGNVYLSGYDPKIITFESKDGKSGDFSKMTLEGKSTINPNGGQDLLSFTGRVDINNLIVDKYEPTLLATVCYHYFTIAGPSVCIDPDPYSTISHKKVCQVQDISLSNQGAPIAITRISEEAFATKTQFRITIKNVGGGDVIKTTAREKCNPLGDSKIEREDIDKVYLQEVKIGDKLLFCTPFVDADVKATGGFIRLINGEGSVICELPSTEYGGSKTAFTTPLRIFLIYSYRNTAERKIIIKKEISSLPRTGGETSPTPTYDTQTPSSAEEPSQQLTPEEIDYYTR